MAGDVRSTVIVLFALVSVELPEVHWLNHCALASVKVACSVLGVVEFVRFTKAFCVIVPVSLAWIEQFELSRLGVIVNAMEAFLVMNASCGELT